MTGGTVVEEPEGDVRTTWQRWYSVLTTFVAPATFLSALLFYFGYVSSRAELRYFGLDVDTVGLSTQDFVMRSPQALLVPVLLLTVAGAAVLVALRALRDRPLGSRAVRASYGIAGVLLGSAVVLLAGYRWLGGWPAYPMVTPLLLVAGLSVLAYLWHRRRAGAGAVTFALLGVATGLFWATTTLAQWTGTGVAHRTARHLDRLPSVVLDTKDRLFLGDGVVTESAVPPHEGQQFLYRYRGLRLLIQAGDRMFVVPERWVASGSTTMVPMDDVRVRFRFVNDPP